jgi:hypothetical protein
MQLIRKIIVGQNPKDAMAYFVGMNVGNGKVSTIVLDEEHLIRYNNKRYLIYIEDPKEGTMLWKSVDNMPCVAEFDCRF